MTYIGMATTILSHIVAALYIQKQKYSKLVTACSWSAYAIFSVCIMLFEKDVLYGFYTMLFMQFFIFYITSIGSAAEKTFLFLTYANSFCICIGVNLILSAFLQGNSYLQIYTITILVLMHIFLYKILVPIYRKSKIFFCSGWWKLNIILVFFLIQFLNQYAFSVVDILSAKKLVFDFVVFSIIFYFTLILIFDSVKDTAEKNRKTYENDELKSIAYIDILTNMQNRSAYMKFTKRQLLNHRHNKGAGFLLVMLDIDGFKKINDTKGHAAGDEVLKCVGAVINKHALSFNCQSFRIGGDEFVLLFENRQISDVEKLMHKMNQELFNLNKITLSYGYSEVDFSNTKPFETAFKKADAIMYSNKQQNKTSD